MPELVSSFGASLHRFARLTIAGVFCFALSGCDDEITPVIEDIAETSCFGPNCNEEDVVEDAGLDTGPDVPRVDTDQCTLNWTYEGNAGGIPSHPMVDSDNITTIASGDTLRRIGSDGTESSVCAQPFRQVGVLFGTPSQNGVGDIFVGTTGGKVYATNRLCVGKWSQPVDVQARSCALKSTPFCDGRVPVIRQAPALSEDGKSLYLLDDRPALHRIDDLGTQGDYQWPHLAAEQEALPGAAPVIVGGDTPYVAFPTRRTVVAVTPTGALRWAFREFLDAEDGEDRHVTSPLAVTKDGKLLFGAGKVSGDQYTELSIYRLKATSPDKDAVVDDGFPRSLQVPLDTVHGIVIGPNESIVLAMAANGVMKLDADGNILWKFIGDAESLRVTSVPAIADDGSVFLTAEPHFVYGVNSDGKRIFRYEPPAGGELETTSPTIAPDGSVLVHLGTELKSYACPDVSSLAVSSWPRYQRNNRNSGNLQAGN